jgi:hypothetical protein
MFRHALGAEPETRADAAMIADAYGSVGEWSRALREGRAGRDAVLLAAVRLAEARGLRESDARTVALYRAFLGYLPSEAGLRVWRDAPDMPERLIDLLYCAPVYRARFDP